MSAATKRPAPGGALEHKKKLVAQFKPTKSKHDASIVALPNTSASPRLQIELDAITQLKNTALKEVALFPLQVKELMNKLGPIETFAATLAENNAIVVATLQALNSIYLAHIKSKNITVNKDKIQSMDAQVAAIEVKKCQQFHNYVTFLSSILMLNVNTANVKKNAGIDEDLAKVQVLVVNSFKDMIATIGLYEFSLLTKISQYNIALVFVLSLLAIQHLRPEKVTEFYTQHLTPFDDLRWVIYTLINTLLPIISGGAPKDAELKSKPELAWLFTTSQFAQGNNNKNNIKPSVFRSNILHLLSAAKFALVTGRRLIKNAQIASSMEETSKKQRDLLSDTWTTLFHYLALKPTTTQITTTNEKQLAEKYDDLSIYTRIFAVIDTHILPNLTKPIILADFLSTSFKIGGLIGVQALSGLFTLMMKHKLEYPQFFIQLYHVCNLDMLYSPYAVNFFKLLSLVLNGPYIPLYITLSFAKKLSALAMYGPTTANIYISALIFNILRKHPMIAYIINRKANVHGGLAKNTTMGVDDINKLYRPEVFAAQQQKEAEKISAAKQAAADAEAARIAAEEAEKQKKQQQQQNSDDESDDDADSAALGPNLFSMIQQNAKKTKTSKQDKFLSVLTKPKAQELVKKTDAVVATLSTTTTNDATKKTTATTTDQALSGDELGLLKEITDTWLNGLDPFIFDILDDKTMITPDQTRAANSSLIEMKDLNKHFFHSVQINSKLLFSDTAPKHASDISHLYASLQYGEVIKQSLEYRSKHLIPTSFQKPLGLLGRSERIITADEKYDEDLRELGKKLDEERNSIESIFMW